jgi:replicative DNA helicase
MTKEEMVVRLISSLCDTPGYFIQTGRIDTETRRRLHFVRENLRKSPLFIEDSCGSGLSEIRACAHVLKKRHGVEILIVDYLQLMTMGGRTNREQEVAEISRRMKELARSLDIPILGLSQR